MTRTVVFVCEYGAFRSRIAAAYFNAAAPGGWRAYSDHLESGRPRGLDATGADRVIGIDCDIPGAELWTVDASSDEALRDEIARRVRQLAIELGRATPGARSS